MFDNVNDCKMFYNANEGSGDRRLSTSYLLQSRNGFIIVITRDKDLVFKLTENYKNMIEVGSMTSADIFILLEKKLRSFSNVYVAIDLVKAFDYIPLIINQAAAYI